MQPYFFPYLGHFQLIAASDRWIVFDIVKYQKRSWMNRNRILHPTQGWQYVNVPIHDAPSGLVSDTRVIDKSAALTRILGQLEHYRHRAPHFAAVADLVREVFARAEGDLLVDLNVQSLVGACDRLGLRMDWSVCSRMDLQLPPITHPGQWALEICSAVGAESYINPNSGRELFRPEEWAERGIGLEFLAPRLFSYACRPYEFVAGLSILDVMMWNEPAAILQHVLAPVSAQT